MGEVGRDEPVGKGEEGREEHRGGDNPEAGTGEVGRDAPVGKGGGDCEEHRESEVGVGEVRRDEPGGTANMLSG